MSDKYFIHKVNNQYSLLVIFKEVWHCHHTRRKLFLWVKCEILLLTTVELKCLLQMNDHEVPTVLPAQAHISKAEVSCLKSAQSPFRNSSKYLNFPRCWICGGKRIIHHYPDTLTGVSHQVSMTTQLEGVDGEWAAADDVTPQQLTKID